MEKQDLALWIVNDPEAGLRAAMEQHAPAVKGILNRILPGRPEDVEECMADVFVALWKNARRLCQSGAPVKAWLVVTARNTGINRLRRLRREAAVPLEENTAGAAQLLGAGIFPMCISVLFAMMIVFLALYLFSASKNKAI